MGQLGRITMNLKDWHIKDKEAKRHTKKVPKTYKYILMDDLNTDRSAEHYINLEKHLALWREFLLYYAFEEECHYDPCEEDFVV